MAGKLTLMAMLFTAPLSAQPAPTGASPGVFGTLYPTSQFPTGLPTGRTQTSQQVVLAGATAPGTLPQGYRPVGNSSPDAPAGGGSGTVMYFHKAAEALAPDSPQGTGALAMATPSQAPTSLPDVAVTPTGTLPAYAVRPFTPQSEVPSSLPYNPTPAVNAPYGSNPIPSATTSPVIAQPLPVQPPKLSPDEVKPLGPEVTSLPTPSQIFLMYDDVVLEKEVIKKVRESTNPLPPSMPPFPAVPNIVPPGTKYQAKTSKLTPSTMVYEPTFVVHHRLHFEEKNAERAGWDFGFIQPMVSAANFYKDCLFWPSSLVTGVFNGAWETSAGKCLPGSATPYLLYPPNLTVSGSVAEVAVFTGLAFMIP